MNHAPVTRRAVERLIRGPVHLMHEFFLGQSTPNSKLVGTANEWFRARYGLMDAISTIQLDSPQTPQGRGPVRRIKLRFYRLNPAHFEGQPRRLDLRRLGYESVFSPHDLTIINHVLKNPYATLIETAKAYGGRVKAEIKPVWMWERVKKINQTGRELGIGDVLEVRGKTRAARLVTSDKFHEYFGVGREPHDIIRFLSPFQAGIVSELVGASITQAGLARLLGVSSGQIGIEIGRIRSKILDLGYRESVRTLVRGPRRKWLTLDDEFRMAVAPRNDALRHVLHAYTERSFGPRAKVLASSSRFFKYLQRVPYEAIIGEGKRIRDELRKTPPSIQRNRLVASMELLGDYVRHLKRIEKMAEKLKSPEIKGIES